MPTYTPPDGDSVDFQFVPYTPPDGDSVEFDFAGEAADPRARIADVYLSAPSHLRSARIANVYLETPAPPVSARIADVYLSAPLPVSARVASVYLSAPPRPPIHVDAPRGVVGAVLKTPALEPPPFNYGPILSVMDYSIERSLNQIGLFSVVISVAEPMAAQIRRGWRISLREENEDGPPWLLEDGIVQRRDFVAVEGGVATLRLEGYTRARDVGARSTKAGLTYAGAEPGVIASDLAGEPVHVPPGDDAKAVSVAFNDISRFQALLKVAEAARYNIRERFDGSLEFVEIDNVPDSGYTLQQIEGGDADRAYEMGIGIIGATPSIAYNGNDIVNRIIPIGADTGPDNTQRQLRLNWATDTSGYDVKIGVSPNGSPYYYLEDEESIERYGLVEVSMVRSDIKNPNDHIPSRQQAANVLKAVASGELIKRRSEVVEIVTDVANGDRIWALPGEYMRVRFVGSMATDEGRGTTWVNFLNRPFLVVKRIDTFDVPGVRRVEFTLSAPAIEIRIPELPNVIIPPPPGCDTSPHTAVSEYVESPCGPSPGSDAGDESVPPVDGEGCFDANPSDDTDFEAGDDDGCSGDLPCCADTTTEVTSSPPAPDIEEVPDSDPALGPWQLVHPPEPEDAFGLTGCETGIGFGGGSLGPNQCAVLVRHGSAGANPSVTITEGDLTIEVLEEASRSLAVGTSTIRVWFVKAGSEGGSFTWTGGSDWTARRFNLAGSATITASAVLAVDHVTSGAHAFNLDLTGPTITGGSGLFGCARYTRFGLGFPTAPSVEVFGEAALAGCRVGPYSGPTEVQLAAGHSSSSGAIAYAVIVLLEAE